MTDEVALWKQRILERKAKGQTIMNWCEEHNVTKGSYNYWCKQVGYAEAHPKQSAQYRSGNLCKSGKWNGEDHPVCTRGNLAGCDDSPDQQSGGTLSGIAAFFSAYFMLNSFITGAEQIFLACGATDFRKQADSLAAVVSMQFKLDPFADQCVFIFCNRKRNGIKILRYDHNGFILAGKSYWMEWDSNGPEPHRK